MKVFNLNNTLLFNSHISNYYLNFICAITLGMLLPVIGHSQSLFTETFDEADGSTTGTSAEGIAWSTSCPNCVAGDWFEMLAGDLEAEDTNGPATMTFTIPAATISGFGNFDITVNFTGSGNIYESSGANVIDSVNVSYAFSTSGSGSVGTLIGNDINIGQIEGLNIAVGTGDLTVTVTVQNWAADEDINFTGISLVGQSPLPVELKYFTGKLQDNNNVVLQWSTASELNNDYFIVQKSNDGKNYKDMERVSGQGTTNIAQYYSIIDNSPFNGQNYYRLKQVDFDGRFINSKTIVFNIKNDEEATVYPTFSENILNVRFSSETDEAGTFEIYDQIGRMVKSIEFAPGTYNNQIQIAELQSGRYFIQIKNGNNIETHNFIKI